MKIDRNADYIVRMYIKSFADYRDNCASFWGYKPYNHYVKLTAVRSDLLKEILREKLHIN